MPERKKVFISYSRADEDVVNQLSSVLRRHHFEPWSMADATAGEDLRARIEEALRSADAFVVVIGADTAESDFARWEWAQALRHSWANRGEKAIIPIVLTGAEVPAFARRRDAITLDRGDAEALEVVAEHVANPSLHVPRPRSPQEQQLANARYAEIREAASALSVGDDATA
jgi:hypothetical protein